MLISFIEWDNSDYIFLWIYGESFGEPYDTFRGYSHGIKIYNSMNPNGVTVYTFYSYEKFDTNFYQWQRFKLSKEHFDYSGWNRIRIDDSDPTYYDNEEQRQINGWEINNLRIGIDTSYYQIDDFDQSFWYSQGAGITPNDPREIQGELMIALEFVDIKHDDTYYPSLQSTWDSHISQGKYSWIPIDTTDDEVLWKTSLTSDELSHSSYARLYIYGYGWNHPGWTGESSIEIEVNGQFSYDFHPIKDFKECYPIGAWSWIEIDIDDLTTGINEFYITDATPIQHTNIGIILFTDVDEDQSAWRYNNENPPNFHGELSYTSDDGELGIYLILFDNKQVLDLERRAYTIELSNEYYNPAQPYKNFGDWLSPDAQLLGEILNMADDWSHSPAIGHDWENPNVYQGYLYDENSYTRGDGADLVVVSGHGLPSEFLLQLYGEQGNPRSFGDQISFRDINYWGWDEGYTEADYYDWSTYSTKGEDGYNFNTEWLVFLSCYILGEEAGGQCVFDDTSDFQTLLYHSLHSLMGYYDLFTLVAGTMYVFVTDFYDFLTTGGEENPKNVLDAFKAVSVAYGQPWGFFYKENHRYDYIWGEGQVSRDTDFLINQKFENKQSDILYLYEEDD